MDHETATRSRTPERVFRAAVTSDTVDVWLISTDVTDSVLTELEALLDDDERERAGNLLFPARRRQFIASHGAVRVILGRHLGLPPGALRWRRGPYGKPELTGAGGAAAAAWPQVSMSKSDGLAALAIAGNRRVGIDIQRLPADADMARMAQRFYPQREALFVSSAAGTAERADRFTKLWVRKEACVKVSGGRLLPGLQLTVLRAGVTAADPSRTSADSYMVRDLRVPLGLRAAVAAEGARPFSITSHLM
jgi:4'-phosphopantetheinyl transferase